MDSGNQLRRQKKSPWSLGQRGKETTPGGKGVGKGAGVLGRESHSLHLFYNAYHNLAYCVCVHECVHIKISFWFLIICLSSLEYKTF